MRRWFALKDIKGFTQIELTVTVLLIGILAAIAAPNINQWVQQRRIDLALVEAETAFQETQQEAKKRGRTCQLTIKAHPDSVLTGNCLVTGDRVLQDVELHHNRSTDWSVSFDMNGENRSVSNDPGTLWLTIPDSRAQPKCLVISVGIGLRRSGHYEQGQCLTAGRQTF